MNSKIFIFLIGTLFKAFCCFSAPFNGVDCEKESIKERYGEIYSKLGEPDREKFRISVRRIYLKFRDGDYFDLSGFCQFLKEKTLDEIVTYGLKENEKKRKFILQTYSDALKHKIDLLHETETGSEFFYEQVEYIKETFRGLCEHMHDLELPAIDSRKYFFEMDVGSSD